MKPRSFSSSRKRLKYILNRVLYLPTKERRSRDMWGYADKEWIEDDVKVSKYLQSIGVPVIPIVAVRKLKQVIGENGELISIKNARKQGIISKDIEPVLVYRAYATHFRLTELPELEYKYPESDNQENIERNKQIADYMIRTLLQVEDLPPKVKADIIQGSYFSYFTWLFARIGNSLGTMHELGIVHGFLLANHNITIDGRMLDFDGSLNKEKKQEYYLNDLKYIYSDRLFSVAKKIAYILGSQTVFSGNNSEKDLIETARISYKKARNGEFDPNHIKTNIPAELTLSIYN